MSEPSVEITAFLPFYRRIAPRDRVTGRLRDAVAAVAAAGRVEPLLDQIWSDVAARVEHQSFRTLIGEFHRFCEEGGRPRTTESGNALHLFRDRLAEPAFSEAILDRHPVLRDRLAALVTGSLEPYAEVLTAYRRDGAALHAEGLADPAQPIVALFGTSGDLHNDNRKVVGLELTGGIRLLFKPRTLLSDHFVRDLYAAAEPFLTHSLRDCLPRSVLKDGYGWQEFVTPRPMTDPDQPARYFYRFGALGAILGAIGATDLHDENLIAGGEFPCVIDTETMTRPDAGVDDDSLPHTLANHLKLSIASTMLLPVLNPASGNDLNMSAIGVAGEQTSRMRRPAVLANDTDGISVQWLPVVYRHGDNLPRLGAEPVSPVTHFADLRDGYLAGLAAVRAGVLGPVLDKYPDIRVRCLIRSTRVYARFIDAGTHPDYLRDPAEAERLLGLLGQYPPFLSEEAAAYVGEQERAALRAGNVPLFLARSDSTELATARTSFPGVHRWTAQEFAHRGLAQNGRRSDVYHRFVLEEALGVVAGAGELSGESVFAPALRSARPGSWWPAIARTIAEVAVPYDGPDGTELGWVAGVGPDSDVPSLIPGTSVSFHDLGGTVAFLERAARSEPTLAEAWHGADRGLDALLADSSDGLFQVPEGVLSGAASMLLVRPKRTQPDWSARMFAGIADRAAAGTLETDLGNGPAGLLMVLLARIEAGDITAAGPEQLGRLADLVHAHLGLARERLWHDVAHGELGLRWATARLGRVLGDSGAVTRSADWLLDRLDRDELPRQAGWCNGAAGLALAGTEILASAGRAEELGGARFAALLDTATALPEGAPVNLSVCHGTSGVIQSLLAIGDLRDAGPDFTDRATEYQERVIAAAREHGFSTGAAGHTSLLGYLLGWAGVGDTDLLLADARRGRSAGRLPVAFHLSSTPLI